MSAFLGPIHHWLYGKVRFQNELVEEILAAAREKGWTNVFAGADSLGVLEDGDLADLIDPYNIHGWLQERVSLVERRLAYTVTSLTKENPERLNEICHIADAFGRKHAFAGESIDDAYRHLETILLNGMPCDRVNVVLQQDEQEISWEQVADIHEAYWREFEGDPAMYDEIRKSLIRGIFAESPVEFKENGVHVYVLARRGSI